MSSSIPFTIAGLDLGLLEHEVKDSDRTYHCFGKPSMFGNTIPALETSLPDFVVVDGIVLALEHGLTAAEVPMRDKATGRPIKGADGKTVMLTVPEDERRARVTYEGVHELPTLGEKRTISVAISVTKTGEWNVKVTANRKSLESPEERQARTKAAAQKRAASNLAAIMAALNPETAAA